MTIKKEHLKNVVTHMIDHDKEKAKVALHQYLSVKMKESIATIRTIKEETPDAKSYRIEKEIQTLVYEKSGKTNGQGYKDGKLLDTDFKRKYPQGFAQKDSAIMGQRDLATALWDKEGSGAKLVGIWLPSIKYGFMV